MAADTIESWERGAFDMDVYIGYQGVGLDRGSRAIGTEVMGGYGITDRLALYVGLGVSTLESMDAAEAGAYLGVFYNALNSTHFDLDLALDLYAEGAGLSRIGLYPYLELNLDSDDEMTGVGAYLRAATALEGDLEAGWTGSFGARLDLTLGAYLTLARDHMLLLEAESEIKPLAGGEETNARFSKVALGYNLVLNQTAELITEAGIGLPTGGEDLSGSFTLGVIFTL